ncbi:hypothetical protein ACHAPU_000989 [Fusarium lateritium]
MSTATFHPFLKLEKSLRLMIWESACYERSKGRPGLHYIKMDENRLLAPLNCDWQTTGRRNRSAYLWHAGLWTACKESREVAAEHWRKQNWPDLREKIKSLNLGDAVWFDSESVPTEYGLIHIKGDYEPWHQVADGFWDMFCITADSWEPLVENWKPIQLDVDDEWGCGHKQDVMDIAVEFDPSWNLEIVNFTPESRLSDYPASLAFLIKILLDIADKKYYREHINLLDKNVLWDYNTDWRCPGHPIYSDCDHQYIELSSISNVDKESPLAFFLEQLDRLLRKKLTIIHYGTTELTDSWGSSIELNTCSLIMPVVRPDNQRPGLNRRREAS